MNPRQQDENLRRQLMQDEKGTRVYPGIYCGIDPGLRSPAFIFYMYPAKLVEIFCFATTATQQKLHAGNRYQIAPNAHVQILPILEGKSKGKDTTVTIAEATETFKDICNSLQQRYNVPMGHIYIEDLAYKAQSSSGAILARWQGVMENLCITQGWDITRLAISHVKSKFAGHGKASKLQMFTAYTQRGYTNCSAFVSCDYDKHPNEDIIDATAILHVGLSTNKGKIAF